MKKQKIFSRLNWSTAGIPIGIFLVYLMIHQFDDLRIAVPEWIGLSGIIICLIAVGDYSFRLKSGWSTGFIVAMGAIYRFLFLFRAPELSDDIFRYVFDGHMLLLRHNPYQAAPLDTIATHPGLSSLAALVNHGDLPTIYPPAAQFVFAVGALAGGIFGMKLVLVLMDLLLCMLMAQMLKRLDQPRSRLILYAWHPLPILEIAGSGHIDGVGLFFLFTAFIFLASNFSKETKPAVNQHPIFQWLTGCFFAAAVLTKWLPLMFLPGVLLMAGSRQLQRVALGFLISTLVMIGLFWPGIQNGFHTLFIYTTNWEFSAFAFRRLRDILDSGISARLILAAVFSMIAGVIYFRCYRDMGGFLKQNSTHNGLLVFQALYALSVTFLLLTPTLHPWYALYLTAFLPFAAGPAGLVLSWSVFLGYRVVIGYAVTGQWQESDIMPVLIVAGPAVAFFAS
nr:hypothetical protein [Desulfobacteraceae bacterium]